MTWAVTRRAASEARNATMSTAPSGPPSRSSAVDPVMRWTIQELAGGRHVGGVHDLYEDEVISRWGERTFQAGNDWWHGKTLDQQRAWKRATEDLVAAWVAAAKAGVSPTPEHARSPTARHVQWLSQIPGSPRPGVLDRKGERPGGHVRRRPPLRRQVQTTPRGRRSSATHCIKFAAPARPLNSSPNRRRDQAATTEIRSDPSRGPASEGECCGHGVPLGSMS